MSANITRKKERKQRRRKRTRKKIFGTPERPRLSVYRSNRHVHVQIINDLKQHTIVSATTREAEVKDSVDYTGNKEAAREVGRLIAERALEEDIEKVVLDTGPFQYHGRVQAVAEAAREEGLNF